MKTNRIIILVVIILAVVALLLWLTRGRTAFKNELSDFAIEDTTSVVRIFMADKNNNTLLLSRQADGNWTVNGKYPASSFNVRMLLQTIHDLALKETVAKTAYNTVVRELSVQSVKVEIYQNAYRINLFGKIRLFPYEKLSKVYYVGGATMSNRGTYMLMEGSSVPFVVYIPGFRGFVSPRYMPIEKYWRDYAIYRIPITGIAQVKVEYPQTTRGSFLMKNNFNSSVSLFTWPEMQELSNIDTLAALNFLSAFRNLSFEALLNDTDPSKKDSVLSSVPFAVITVTDTAGLDKTIRIFFKEGSGETDLKGNLIPYDLDRLYALVNDGQDFVLIQYYVFDKVLRPRSFFQRENSSGIINK